MQSPSLLIVLLCCLCVSCKPSAPTTTVAPIASATIAKWHDNHRAAISLTHDAGWLSEEAVGKVNALVLESRLHLGYEMVTANFRQYPELMEYYRRSMSGESFSLFGHGDTHIDHDKLDYDSAFASFSRCAATMQSFGLRPIAYAYPNGGGFLSSTQRAVANAGFLSARAFSFGVGEKSLIMPDSITTPENWYLLPSLVMQDFAFEHCDTCINSNQELVPYLDAAVRRSAWLTLTYHAIGDEQGWGYYKLSEFRADIAAVLARDFWSASLQDITLYARERAKAHIELNMLDDTIEIKVTDNLDNILYNYPLTVVLRLPSTWKGKAATLTLEGRREQMYSRLTDSLLLHLLPNERTYKLSLQ